MFHIHKWSKWSKVEGEVNLTPFRAVSRHQERSCERCGKIQRSLIEVRKEVRW